ncbi:hypothetical protein PB1_04795 [Bacillus methanolicus PB1]|uniref:Uncharacterized protein n=1 Tax=Bacillus methanolicus PB1 TaxID=997296 RepID=I3E6V0_BACMT|nr:hypothetical protein PB1_04795 [Bacillus methanolicus PB1]
MNSSATVKPLLMSYNKNKEGNFLRISMDVLTAIEKRREITHFSPDPIPDEVLDKLVKSLYLFQWK